MQSALDGADRAVTELSGALIGLAFKNHQSENLLILV
jgi:environmental stress-induced protein Ves